MTDNKFNSYYIMMISVAFIDGALRITNIPTFYLWKDYLKLSPGVNCLLRYLTKLPWCIKPVFAYFSDRHYIFGYRTKIYFIINGIIETASFLLLSIEVNSVLYVTVLVFIHQATIAFRDSLAEGLMVVLSKDEDKQSMKNMTKLDQKTAKSSSQKYVSIIFILRFVGALSSSYVAGLLLETFTPHQLLGLSAAFPIVATLQAAFFFKEKRVKNTKHITDKFDGFSITEIFEFIKEYNLKSYLFFVIIMLLWPNTINALRYFLIDTLHFSTKDVGLIFTISSLVYIVYMFFMNTFFRNYSLKNYYTSICILMILNMIVRYLQIVPELYSLAFLFAVFDQSINNLFYDLPSIPLLAIVCRSCPESKEATYYAFFVSVSNFFCSFANFTGYIFLDLIGVTATDFTNIQAVNMLGLIWSFLCWNLNYYMHFPSQIKLKGHKDVHKKETLKYDKAQEEAEEQYSEPNSSKQDESEV